MMRTPFLLYPDHEIRIKDGPRHPVATISLGSHAGFFYYHIERPVRDR